MTKVISSMNLKIVCRYFYNLVGILVIFSLAGCGGGGTFALETTLLPQALNDSLSQDVSGPSDDSVFRSNLDWESAWNTNGKKYCEISSAWNPNCVPRPAPATGVDFDKFMLICITGFTNQSTYLALEKVEMVDGRLYIYKKNAQAQTNGLPGSAAQFRVSIFFTIKKIDLPAFFVQP